MSNFMSNFAWANPAGNSSASASAAASPPEDQPLLSRLSAGLSPYIPLSSSAHSNEEEAYISLSRWERLLAFLICLAGSAVCFFVAFFVGLPMLLLKPSKFTVSFTMGSLLVMAGFVVLVGPTAQFAHLTSKERLPFTITYIASLLLTLFFSLGSHKSYSGCILASLVQVGALVFYIGAYFPGGVTTLSFGARMVGRSLLPS